MSPREEAAELGLLPVRSVHVLARDGGAMDRRTVRCPAHGHVVALDECVACAESGGTWSGGAPRLDYAMCRHVGAGVEARRAAADRLLDVTPVSAVMTTDVLAVRPDVSLQTLTELLFDRGLSGAPVVDEEGRPVGVVTRADLLDERRVAGGAGEAVAPGARARGEHLRVELGPGVHEEELRFGSVAEAMTRAPLTVPEGAPVARAAALMARRGVHRVLVVSEDGKLSGIVTTSDIVRWVAERGGVPLPEA